MNLSPAPRLVALVLGLLLAAPHAATGVLPLTPIPLDITAGVVSIPLLFGVGVLLLALGVLLVVLLRGVAELDAVVGVDVLALLIARFTLLAHLG